MYFQKTNHQNQCTLSYWQNGGPDADQKAKKIQFYAMLWSVWCTGSPQPPTHPQFWLSSSVWQNKQTCQVLVIILPPSSPRTSANLPFVLFIGPLHIFVKLNLARNATPVLTPIRPFLKANECTKTLLCPHYWELDKLVLLTVSWLVSIRGDTSTCYLVHNKERIWLHASTMLWMKTSPARLKCSFMKPHNRATKLLKCT